MYYERYTKTNCHVYHSSYYLGRSIINFTLYVFSLKEENIMSKTVEIGYGFKATYGTKTHTSWTLFEFVKGGKESRNPKTGEITITKDRDVTVGYYPTLRQCVAKTVELVSVSEEGTSDLGSYVSRLESLSEELGGVYS